MRKRFEQPEPESVTIEVEEKTFVTTRVTLVKIDRGCITLSMQGQEKILIVGDTLSTTVEVAR